MKILVVEDSITQAIAIQRILKNHGWQVIIAKNGKEGLALAKEKEPDIILSDLIMPEMDGLEFCTAIKSGPLKATPFLLLSAHGELEDQVKGLDSGADDYLSKPAEELELVARIRSASRIKQYQDEQKAANQKLQEAYDQKVRELEQARITQSTILPNSFPEIPGLKIASKYIPMEEIGGDFYDVVLTANQQVGFLVADVTGHGVPAALISFMASSLFKSFHQENESPAKTLEAINDFLYDKIEDGKFVTAWYGLFNPETASFNFASAGHPPGYLIRPSSREVIPITGKGLFLGPFSQELNKIEEKEIQIQVGDRIILYTDAILEAMDANEKEFGFDRLESLFLEHSSLGLGQWLDAIYDSVLDFSGTSTLDDDVTMVCFEVTEDWDGGSA